MEGKLGRLLGTRFGGETGTQPAAKPDANGAKPKAEQNGSSQGPETNGAARVLFMDTPQGLGERARITADAMRAAGLRPAGSRVAFRKT